MRSKQATVKLDGQLWTVLDTGDRIDGMVWCALSLPGQGRVMHMWIEENQIEGIV